MKFAYAFGLSKIGISKILNVLIIIESARGVMILEYQVILPVLQPEYRGLVMSQ